jgi:hypothetical protein
LPFHHPMKKILILSAFFSISSLSFGQSKSGSPIPIDSISHLISYEEVVQVPDATTDVIYNRALAWFRSYFKNPGEVIRQNNLSQHVIMGKPRFKIYNPADKDGTKSDAGNIQYSITVSAKEGRFKYELTEYNWKQISYFAAEKWMDTKTATYTKVYADYLKQMDEYSRALIANLKNSMTSEKPVKDKDKW